MSETRPDSPRRSPWGRRLFIVAIVVIVAVMLFRVFAPHRGGHGGAAPQTVGVAQAVTGSMPVTLSALGTVTPLATVTVVPQLSGYLTEVAFTEGQDVTKGQFLAQIDPRQYEVQLEQDQGTLAKDQASLAQARSDYARFIRLQKQNSISEQQVSDQGFLVQQDEAAIKIDQANIAAAQLDLAYCHIVAPVSGRVGLRLIDPGNFVTSSSTTGIAVITTIKPITVIFTVPQNQLAAVLAQANAGQKLQVTAYSADNSTKIATGTLEAIDNQMSTTTGTVELRAAFANEDEALFPNEFVNVVLLVKTLTGAVLVPTPAVQTGSPGTFVYVVNANNTVSLRKITPGQTDGTNTVVTAGLKAGETVVTDGVDRLTDGAHVVVAAPEAAAPATPAPDTKKKRKWSGQKNGDK